MSFSGYISDEARQLAKQEQSKRRAQVYQKAYDSYIKMGFSEPIATEHAIQEVEYFDRRVTSFEMFYG